MFNPEIETRLRREQKIFGQFLKQRRLQSGFATHKALSYETGISIRLLEKMEKAQGLLTLDKLIRLSETFNLPIAGLFDYRQTLTAADLREGFYEGDKKMLSKEIGERIYQLRKSRGITHLDLQIETLLDKKAIHNYEEGARVFEFRTLIIFAEVLQIELFDLFRD